MSKLPGRIDAEAILETLAKLRESIPFELSPQPRAQKEGPIPALDGETVNDFELATVAEGLETLSAELAAAIDRVREKALADALRVYYAAEELARDPANAHLIPHVEAMREAYERDYGMPIPPKD